MSQKKIIVGKFGKPYGVHGWIKVNSFTIPETNILNFNHWFILKQNNLTEIKIESIREQGQVIIVKLPHCLNPETARLYTNIDIYVDREEFPALSNDEYYWTDLEGLKVVNTENIEFGHVDHVLATGANDVLVVKSPTKERLIPYIKNVIINVDLKAKVINVDWDEDF